MVEGFLGVYMEGVEYKWNKLRKTLKSESFNEVKWRQAVDGIKTLQKDIDDACVQVEEDTMSIEQSVKKACHSMHEVEKSLREYTNIRDNPLYQQRISELRDLVDSKSHN